MPTAWRVTLPHAVPAVGVGHTAPGPHLLLRPPAHTLEHPITHRVELLLQESNVSREYLTTMVLKHDTRITAWKAVPTSAGWRCNKVGHIACNSTQT